MNLETNHKQRTTAAKNNTHSEILKYRNRTNSGTYPQNLNIALLKQ
jgi:hypothetical protein